MSDTSLNRYVYEFTLLRNASLRLSCVNSVSLVLDSIPVYSAYTTTWFIGFFFFQHMYLYRFSSILKLRYSSWTIITGLHSDAFKYRTFSRYWHHKVIILRGRPSGSSPENVPVDEGRTIFMVHEHGNDDVARTCAVTRFGRVNTLHTIHTYSLTHAHTHAMTRFIWFDFFIQFLLFLFNTPVRTQCALAQRPPSLPSPRSGHLLLSHAQTYHPPPPRRTISRRLIISNKPRNSYFRRSFTYDFDRHHRRRHGSDNGLSSATQSLPDHDSKEAVINHTRFFSATI